MATYPMTMYGIREARPGPRWRTVFTTTWPAYRAWYLRDGRDARPALTTAAAALARHMPELLPTWARLAEQAGYDDDATAMLTQWNLPAFAPAACSQVATVRPGPGLLRNYDYSPDLFECVSMSSEYLQPVIGTSDCLWGLLDGMNGAGLAISLAYGGDRTTGAGFAIPLVVRYLLEVCCTVAEAKASLARLPVAMSYNLTMIDRSGAVSTAHLRPGFAAEFGSQPVATNHRWQEPVDPSHAARYRSVERFDRLTRLLADQVPVETLADRLLRPPLYATDYSHGFGTLYTAEYRPAEQTLVYRWPESSWIRTFDSVDDTMDVVLRDADSG